MMMIAGDLWKGLDRKQAAVGVLRRDLFTARALQQEPYGVLW